MGLTIPPQAMCSIILCGQVSKSISRVYCHLLCLYQHPSIFSAYKMATLIVPTDSFIGWFNGVCTVLLVEMDIHVSITPALPRRGRMSILIMLT